MENRDEGVLPSFEWMFDNEDMIKLIPRIITSSIDNWLKIDREPIM